MRVVLTAAVLLWSLVAAFAADPVGKYDVEGSSPDGSKYSGTVTVTKTDQTFRVVWIIGDTRYIGTAIGNKDFIAVSYRSGNNTGLALYGTDGDDWKGVWTYAGGTTMGTEVRNRR